MAKKKKQKKNENYFGLIGFKINLLNTKWINELDEILNEYDLNKNLYFALLILKNTESDINQIDLGYEIGLEKMMTSKIIKELESKKLIIRKSNPQDKRANFLKISKSGIEKLNSAQIAVINFENKFFKSLNNHTKFINKIESIYND